MNKFYIDKYVQAKIKDLELTDKSFKAIYNLMFRDDCFTMFEWTDGSKIKKMTYGQCRDEIEKISRWLSLKLKDVKKGAFVGLYAQNSIKWIQVFWSILKCGFKPLLLNTKMARDRLDDTLKYYEIGAVVSDGEIFNQKTILIDDIGFVEEGAPVEKWENQIIVMSSGTSLQAKLCCYDGESFYYQLLNSADIIKKSKPIKKHYEGNLKQLMFLPLYHIFGLAAMFMWFAFFSRTFVVLKDQNPETILFTIKKHKVTHIFAVPLFWEVVYKKFKQTLNMQDEKTIRKVKKGLALVKKFKSLWLGKKLFKPVREKIFGESICFLISGGSSISSEILTFFNSIGYHLSNGYGMSEIGITSVELSSKFKNLTDCSVGKPFTHVKYKIDENGALLVKAKSMAKEIYINGKKEQLCDGWYNTLDIVKCEKDRYFICGRKDDMIVGPDGENLNPAWVEKQISLDNVENVCILNINKIPTLLVQVSKLLHSNKLLTIKEKAKEELCRLNVAQVVKNIVFTNEPLILGNEFKLNRKRLEKVTLIEETQNGFNVNCENETIERLKQLFADALGTESDKILPNAHFFFDLHGNSLDYFSLISAIQAEFCVKFPQQEGNSLYTILEFYNFIQKNN